MNNVVKFHKPRTFTSAEAMIEKVRLEIFESGATYKVLAGKANVSQTTVQRLANGKTRWPRPTTLFPLLHALGLAMKLVREGKLQAGDDAAD